MGTSATVSATDTADWAFTHWEGDISSRSRSVTFTMDEAKTVTAVFIFECDVVGCRRDAGGDDGGTSAPEGASVRLADGTFTVSWEAVTGADRYRVRYRNDPEGEWTGLADDDATDTLLEWRPESMACGATYTFQVEAHGDGRASDAEWGPATTMGVVTTDCELQPTFASSEYTFTIAEASAAGTTVGHAAAAPNAGLSYELTSGNEAGAFAIGATSGEITVAGTLDDTVTPSHTLTVLARDGRGGTANATESIDVSQ